jgi:hypothetical protein
LSVIKKLKGHKDHLEQYTGERGAQKQGKRHSTLYPEIYSEGVQVNFFKTQKNGRIGLTNIAAIRFRA